MSSNPRMSASIKGWCPNAWRPMMAGDGLLVRVRPRVGRLTRAQTIGLCEAALAHGSGLIDLTSRANLQIRGVSESAWPALIAILVDLGLVDPDPVTEARRNILVAPDWVPGDGTERIATALMERLDDLPELPAKVGFAIDAGLSSALSQDPGDFRIERGQSGGLILRADGRDTGVAIALGTEADALIGLAHWFVESGGVRAGRMARHEALLPDWALGEEYPAAAALRSQPGKHPCGAAYGLPFGRIEAQALINLMLSSSAEALRITPWRIVILEGADSGEADGFVHDPANAAIRVDACPGAPSCPQATVETRDIANRLMPHIAGRLHVSGCAKGCARAQPADVTLTGCNGLFDLAFHARAGEPPALSGLSAAQTLNLFGAT
ncbi:cobalamin biosynthesis protein CobG [Rhizorhapis suberifaciens]|uniref:Precorrin-3B synthase n=1 Tax=Rhizorhapis suberifaciens TaxID=13656 RepID=A0A840HRA0_9SPHN|nr:cobalamin biosynthesis protein CobG [Rhizorhapis suberifaciens]MBB4640403.1 precorrin-3B synthase [Rhizorhapis suberifaciens]